MMRSIKREDMNQHSTKDIKSQSNNFRRETCKEYLPLNIEIEEEEEVVLILAIEKVDNVLIIKMISRKEMTSKISKRENLDHNIVMIQI